jgi:hypothetical protein
VIRARLLRGGQCPAILRPVATCEIVHKRELRASPTLFNDAMMMRRKWVTIAGLFAVSAAAMLLSAYSGGSSPQGRQPVQPINFPHPLHVQDTTVALNCLYCHFAGGKSPDVGMPAVSTCVGCHTLAARDRPEVQKLINTYTDTSKHVTPPVLTKPIPWIRIHKVPKYVHFPHMRHVNAGVTCQTCHGPIQDMMRVYQFSSLNMGWCVNCHIQNKARYDCATCHF